MNRPTIKIGNETLLAQTDFRIRGGDRLRPYKTRSATAAYKTAQSVGGQAFRRDGDDSYYVRVSL